MSSVIDSLTDEERDAIERTKQPDWTEPMLATLTDETFDDPAWVYERKLDGERCLAFRRDGDCRLASRNNAPLSQTYPDVLDDLAAQTSGDLIVDGEIVAFEGNITSFSRLQDRMKIRNADEARKSHVAVYFYVFDLLHADGYDCTKLPLRTRKRLLQKAVQTGGRIRFTPHRNEAGESYLAEACEKGWEGLIAKDGDAPYVHSRSKKWLKFKCVNRQEFVIVGFTEPKGDRTSFGSIVVGFHDSNGKLVCAGKVGTGFDEETLASLGKKMRSHERKTAPIDRGETPSGEVHWITPELIAEVAFTEWTSDDRLRHPRFVGLRRDRDPSEVVKERPQT